MQLRSEVLVSVALVTCRMSCGALRKVTVSARRKFGGDPRWGHGGLDSNTLCYFILLFSLVQFRVLLYRWLLWLVCGITHNTSGSTWGSRAAT